MSGAAIRQQLDLDVKSDRLLLNLTHATIEETTIYPTAEQAIKSLIVCQMLSNCYRDIHLFRFDDQTGEVYLLAGDDLRSYRPPFWRLEIR